MMSALCFNTFLEDVLRCTCEGIFQSNIVRIVGVFKLAHVSVVRIKVLDTFVLEGRSFMLSLLAQCLSKA